MIHWTTEPCAGCGRATKIQRKWPDENACCSHSCAMAIANGWRVTYRRIPHAAHYAPEHPDRGHDLEEWTVRADTLEEARRLLFSDRKATLVGAKYHCGYVANGKQFWTFVATARLSDNVTCAWCDARRK